jgi:hypothetical protein
MQKICLSCKTSLLACNHFQMGGGDYSIQQLSFAQEKYLLKVQLSFSKVSYVSIHCCTFLRISAAEGNSQTFDIGG